MVDLIKTIIKWVIVALLFILLISFLAKLSNRSSKNTNKPLTNTGVRTIKKNNTDTTNNTNISNSNNTVNEDTPKEVNTPDTASSATKEIIIGLIILGGTTYYIYRRREVTE